MTVQATFLRLLLRNGPLVGLLVLLNLATVRVWADYDGLLISATAQTPITPGDPLDITVVVRNTGTFPWIGLELPAWVVQLDNPSWPASWPFLSYASWVDVDVDQEVSVIATLDPSELPTAPGNYSLRLVAAYNEYDLDLVLMPGSPLTVNFTMASGNQPPGHRSYR